MLKNSFTVGEPQHYSFLSDNVTKFGWGHQWRREG